MIIRDPFCLESLRVPKTIETNAYSKVSFNFQGYLKGYSKGLEIIHNHFIFKAAFNHSLVNENSAQTKKVSEVAV